MRNSQPHPSVSNRSPSPASQHHIIKPQHFNVPFTLRPVLDLLSTSTSPESNVKRALLSNDPDTNAVALVGMGGVGKSTILCALGRDKQIWAKFPDGVWFVELGHDVTLSNFTGQLQQLVKSAFPDFEKDFEKLAVSEVKHRSIITQLMEHLVRKRFLLLFDNVWDVNQSVYRLVCSVCKAIQANESATLKVLTSTRSRDIADVLTINNCITLNPEHSDPQKCLGIFCFNARIDSSELSSLSTQNRNALDHILETCGGLPLALSVAGSAVKELMDPSTDQCDYSALSEYWDALETNIGQLTYAESGDGHSGFANALETSLQFLEKGWEAKKKKLGLCNRLTAREMFQSLCIMQKQMSLPLNVIEKLWGVDDVRPGVRTLSRQSLVSEVREEGKGIVGVQVHDLVLDMSVRIAESRGGVMKWHARLLDAYGQSAIPSGSVEDNGNDKTRRWWDLDGNENYMVDNVARHLLGAERVSELLRLLTDYRWLKRTSDFCVMFRFEKILSQWVLLREYLQIHHNTETGNSIVSDIDDLHPIVFMSMILSPMQSREECIFQIYRRLREVTSKSGILERLVHSIERYELRPSAFYEPGVLVSGRNLSRRVLEMENPGYCMSVCAGGKEVVVGGNNGNVWVFNDSDGSNVSLFGHEEDEDVVDVYADHSSGTIYSCCTSGRVILWREHKKWLSLHVEGLQEDEWIRDMEVLSSLERIVLGTNKGRLMVVDIESGSTIRTIDAHSDYVNSLTAGGNDKIVVSASRDGTIRVWNTSSFEPSANRMEGHKNSVNNVAISGDGKLLASVSDDQTIRLWDIEKLEQLWSSGEQSYRIEKVLFSGDGQLMYSADDHGTISVWQLRDNCCDVLLTHTLRHMLMDEVHSLCIGDDSELLALNGSRVHVWDGRDVGTSGEGTAVFLHSISNCAISADGATMVAFNQKLSSFEIRNVCDLMQRTNRIVSSFNSSSLYFGRPLHLTVSSNQKFFAFTCDGCGVVYLCHEDSISLLHDLDSSIESCTHHQKSSSTSSQESDVSSDSIGSCVTADIDSLWFSPDSSTLSVRALVKSRGEDEEIIVKSIVQSWNVSSREQLDESQPDGESDALNITASSPVICDQQSPTLEAHGDRIVKDEHDGKSFIIVTLESLFTEMGISEDAASVTTTWEDIANYSPYFPDILCLRLPTKQGGSQPFYIFADGGTGLTPQDEPPLPPLQQPCSPPSKENEKDVERDTESEEVYDVFISHAGDEKFTIAEPLYELLVKLGLKVFLDRAELRPGQNAPQKMINAMQTAKIAIVILSPEFAARKWTLKELMCFLERFQVDGERGVIIIPVFYRLTLKDCKDENSLFGLVDENGESVFMKEGFLQRMVREKEYGVADVLKALQSLRDVTGIENKNGVTNGTSEEEKVKQMTFVKTIAAAIVEAKKRLETGGAAGPSR